MKTLKSLRNELAEKQKQMVRLRMQHGTLEERAQQGMEEQIDRLEAKIDRLQHELKLLLAQESIEA